MATFVLVHGMGLGGWCWRDVKSMLIARGHEVFTPTLTGQGERRHLPVAGVTTHVADIAECLAFEDLQEVHLVLHGYAGILAGPLAAAGDRLASLTYLGGYVALPGQSYSDFSPEHGDHLDDWGITDPADREWVGPRLTPGSEACVFDPVEYDPQDLADIPTSYVRTTQPALPSLESSWHSALAAGWRTQDIACGHAMMIAAPRQTSRLLATLGPRDALPPVFPGSPRIALW